jgi:hypothetical protein
VNKGSKFSFYVYIDQSEIKEDLKNQSLKLYKNMINQSFNKLKLFLPKSEIEEDKSFQSIESGDEFSEGDLDLFSKEKYLKLHQINN